MINSFECLGMQDPFGHEAKKIIGDETKQFDKSENFQVLK